MMPLALSIKPPWTFFILKEIKPVENRPWWSKHTGVFFVHASKSYDDKWKSSLTNEASIRAQKHLNNRLISSKGKVNWFHGHIVGAAIHEGTDQIYNDPWCSSHPGMYYFRIRGPVIRFTKPVLCPGQLKFFRPKVTWDQFVLEDRENIEHLQYLSRSLKLEKGIEGQTLVP